MGEMMLFIAKLLNQIQMVIIGDDHGIFSAAIIIIKCVNALHMENISG